MNVLHIINELNDSIGGAEQLLLGSLPFYQTQLGKIDVLVLRDIDSFWQRKLQQEISGRLITLSKISLYNPILVLKLIPYFKNYDIVHVHLFPSLYWVGLAKWLSQSNVLLIYTEHSTNNKRRNNPLLRIMDKYIYSKYDKIVCVSPLAEKKLKDHLRSNNDKTLTIKNGIDLFRIKNAKQSDTLEGGEIKIMMVARFHYPKDHLTLIKSLLYLSEKIHLYFAGEGDLLEKCKLFTKSLSLQDRVHFLGFRNDIPSLLKTASIIVISSAYEGLSLASIEAMACGKPFIASDVEGLREIVEGAGVLFKFGDEKDLASKIQVLLDDPIYYNQIVEKCIERTMDYDIRKMVNNYIDVYHRLLDEQ